MKKFTHFLLIFCLVFPFISVNAGENVDLTWDELDLSTGWGVDTQWQDIEDGIELIVGERVVAILGKLKNSGYEISTNVEVVLNIYDVNNNVVYSSAENKDVVLGSGDSTTLGGSWSWIPDEIGDYVIEFKIDPNNNIEESNKDNNVIRKNLEVVEADNDDPYVTIVNVQTPTSLITANTATIIWETGNPSNSDVHYWSESGSDENWNWDKIDDYTQTNHSVVLKNLKADTQYFFTVSSRREQGSAKAESEIYSFKTLSESDEIKIFDIYENNASADFFSIKWSTNGYYDCTLIYSTKDGDLDDDYLYSGRDQDDRIFGSNYPKSSSNGTYNYYVDFNNQGAGTEFFEGDKAYYEVICYDSDRNKKISDVYSFDLNFDDEDSLKIYNINVPYERIRSDHVYVTWDTNIPASSFVYYNKEGLTSQSWQGSDDLTTTHEVLIPSLETFTTYEFKISSKDGEGNIVRSEIMNFTTTTGSTQDDTSSDNDTDETNANIRIIKLERRISELEQQVIELEKKLTNLDEQFAEKYAGTMFLDVENYGRLWYVDPESNNRFYFENGEAALSIGSKLATGITYEDLQKIPVGVSEELYNLTDSDGDGLSDRLESALGSDPNNQDSDGDGFSDKEELANGYDPVGEKYSYNQSLIDRLEGKMLLQVSGANSHGEIWYIQDGKRWYGGTEDSMYEIMKARSLGATADDIRKIEVGEVESE